MATIRSKSPLRMGAARHLRKNRTLAEEILWSLLRKKSLGVRVRSQYAIGDYSIDFYCHQARLAIELDGPMHSKEHDAKRDEYLIEHGIFTLRIPNEKLIANDKKVFDQIKELVEIRLVTQPWKRKSTSDE